MNEHEKLKKICDEIWYELKLPYIYNSCSWFRKIQGEYYDKWFNIEKDFNVREIIFTPEFKNAFEKELKNRNLYTEERQNQKDNWDRENYVPDEQIEIQCDYAMFWLLYNLHDPVTYLYNLLFNK